MKLAITISLVPEARGGPFVFWDDLASACATAAELGFDGVEIFPPSAESLNVAQILGLLRRHRLELAAIGTGAGWVIHRLHLCHADASRRARARQFAGAIIEKGAALAAPAIVGSMQGRVEAGVSREQALAWLGESLGELSARAQQGGQTLLYEPLNRYETNIFTRASEAAAFLEERGLANVKLLCDLFHMNIEETSIADTLRNVRHCLGHIHLADSNRCAAGFGHTHFTPIVAVLREIGYGGFLSGEILPLPDSRTAAAQTAHFFREQAGRIKIDA